MESLRKSRFSQQSEVGGGQGVIQVKGHEEKGPEVGRAQCGRRPWAGASRAGLGAAEPQEPEPNGRPEGPLKGFKQTRDTDWQMGTLLDPFCSRAEGEFEEQGSRGWNSPGSQ